MPSHLNIVLQVQILPPELGGTAAWLPVDEAVRKFNLHPDIKPAQHNHQVGSEGLHATGVS